MWLQTANKFNIIFQIFIQYHGNLQTLPNSNPGKAVRAKIKIGDAGDQFYCYDHKLLRENGFRVLILQYFCCSLCLH